MPSSDALLIPYVSTSVLQRLRADASSALRSEVEGAEIAALFVDVADSTRIVESLAEREREGAERFSVLLGRYFAELMDTVERFGGEVFKFDGDAVLAIWRAFDADALTDAVRDAGACAFAFQDAAPRLQSASSGGLSLRAGIGAGCASIVHVSDEIRRSEMFLVGPAFAETLGAARVAPRGGVAFGLRAGDALGLATSAADQAAARAAVAAVRTAAVMPVSVSHSSRLRHPRSAAGIDAAVASALSRYVPRVVRTRSLAQGSQWLAELRTLTTVFVGLGLDGIEIDAKLFDAAGLVLQRVAELGGDVARVSAHRNGIGMLAAFGLPPHAHEDDADRASSAAMALREELADCGVPVSIGVTTGTVFCGPVGSLTRREYTMIGDSVNVAARLMGAASGAVLCDAQTRKASRGRVRFGPPRVLVARGRKAEIAVFEPIGYGQTRRPAGMSLVGREEECARLEDALSDLEKRNRGGAFLIEGEAGIGKSRLAMFAVDRAHEHGLDVVRGDGEPTENQVPFYPWRAIVAALLGLSRPGDEDREETWGTPAAASVDLATVETLLVRVCGLEALQARRMAPLLGAVLGSPLRDNGWTARLAPQARVEQTAALVLRILSGRTESADARVELPEQRSAARLVVVLEDIHWFDSSSWALLRTAVQTSRSLLLLVTSRPRRNAEYGALVSSPEVSRIVVEGLAREAIATLAARRLDVSGVPPALVSFLFEHGRGHPFFSEELIDMLRSQGALLLYGGECRLAVPLHALESIGVPGTVEGVVSSRIDALKEGAGAVLKTASILSGVFTAADVVAVDPACAGVGEIGAELQRLVDDALLVAVAEREGFMFRHAITQTVAYEMVPYALRRRLHKAAAETLGTREETPAAVLAYHWSRAVDRSQPQAEVLAKALAATEAAGEQAVTSFANSAAVALFTDGLALADLRPDLVDRGRRARWYRHIGEAAFGAGWPDAARSNLADALGLLGRPLPRSRARLRAALAGEALRQVLHRLLPAVAVDIAASGRRDTARVEALCEQAATGVSLSFVLLLARESEAAILANLRALNCADRIGPSVELANSAVAFSLIAGTLFGERAERHYFEIARRAAESTGDANSIARVWWMRAFYLLGRARWDDAYAVLEKSCGIFEELGDGRWHETVVMAMGNVFTLSSRFERALAAYTRGHRAAHARGDVQNEAWSHVGMSHSTFLLGRHHEALAMLAKVEAWMGGNLENLGDGASELAVLGMRAAILVHEGDGVGARRVLEQAHARLGQPTFMYHAVTGYTFLTEAALRLLEAAPRGSAQGPGKPAPAVRERDDADVSLQRMAGDFERVLWAFGRRLPIGRAQALVWRGMSLWLRARRGAAFRAWDRAAALASALGIPYDQALAHYEAGRHLPSGDPRRLRRLKQAHALFAQIGAEYWVRRVETEIAEDCP